MSPRSVVIAVGNPYRHDDAVAAAVLARLRELDLPPGTHLAESDGDVAELIDLWDGAALAVVVDAVHAHPPSPGKVHRVEAGDLRLPAGQASSHGLGLGEAVDLGAALGRLPDRLVIYAVEGAEFGFGVGLSAPVAAVVPLVAGNIRDEL
ncbi:hydrogenase maturation protease [Flindersiella endophytica]